MKRLYYRHREHLGKPAIVLLSTLLFATGCQQKMAAQPSFRPDYASDFFADGRASRPPVTGTVARGHLQTDTALFFGSHHRPDVARAMPAQAEDRDSGDTQSLLAAEAAQFEGMVDEFPIPITRDVVEYGRNRYMIYCVVCHDEVGTGHGKIVERGYTRPPSYHIERLRQAPVGYLFRVISQGYGSMPSYASQVPARDRWAIVSYIRALQLSQHFPVDDLPEGMTEKLTAAVGGSP